MKHFYIIGNGFDVFTGFKSKYSDFNKWLQYNYIFIYENLAEVYDIQGEWWNNFEESLAKLNFKQFISKYQPKPLSEEYLKKIITKRESNKLQNSTFTNLHFESACANRLKGLLKILTFCFKEWVEDFFKKNISAQLIKIEKKDSFFMNFNYTDTLEVLYNIPADRVLHIHGRAIEHEPLIFGHGTILLGDSFNADENACSSVLSKYHKNPFDYIYKNPQLTDILKDVEHIHIYGFSFSEIDLDYIDYIYKHVPKKAQWEISWYSFEDKDRINSFILDHFAMKERCNLMKLDDIIEGKRFITQIISNNQL